MAYDNLTTVSSLKSWIKNTGTSDDGVLGTLIQVASEASGRYCGRPNLGSLETYSENYFRRQAYVLSSHTTFDVVLRHYPVTTLTSVTMNNSILAILNETNLQGGQAGVYLLEDEDPRILKFQALYPSWPITVAYSVSIAAGCQRLCG
jgi:hypothetical protein